MPMVSTLTNIIFCFIVFNLRTTVFCYKKKIFSKVKIKNHTLLGSIYNSAEWNLCSPKNEWGHSIFSSASLLSFTLQNGRLRVNYTDDTFLPWTLRKTRINFCFWLVFNRYKVHYPMYSFAFISFHCGVNWALNSIDAENIFYFQAIIVFDDKVIIILTI